MRVVLGVLSLLLVVAIVGVLAKKQLGSASAPAAAPAAAAAAAAGVALPATTPGATPQQQSQQVQQQIKQNVEGLMQQARPMPEDK